jgi:subtilase family serine protease
MIPAVTPPGSYYVIAKADGGGVVVETQEANNVLARSLQIGGDLVVSAFTAPARSGAGGSIVVSDTTINQGAGRVAASMTRFYLSLDWMFDTSDVLLGGARSVPELDSGATSSGSTTVSIPATAATGAYYLIAKADADGAVLETSESNNASSRGFQIGPDLYLQALSVPSKGGAGSAIAVADTAANQGGGLAAESVVAFYLSTDWILDPSDIPLNPSRAVPALPSGGTSSAATTLTIPATTAAGVHYIIAKADASQAVPETQEGNNTRYGSIRIGPDLRVSSLWPSPTKVAPGGSVNVTDTIVNQGGGAAGSSTTTYYLSTNYTIEAGDVALGTRIVPALAAGASNTAVTALTIPAGSATGSFYLLAHADSTTQVGESPETNNVTAVAFQVTMTP